MDREAIKALIRSKGFTYESLADLIGVSQAAIESVVSGRTKGATARFSFAKALGVEVSDIWPIMSDETAA